MHSYQHTVIPIMLQIIIIINYRSCNMHYAILICITISTQSWCFSISLIVGGLFVVCKIKTWKEENIAISTQSNHSSNYHQTTKHTSSKCKQFFCCIHKSCDLQNHNLSITNAYWFEVISYFCAAKWPPIMQESCVHVPPIIQQESNWRGGRWVGNLLITVTNGENSIKLDEAKLPACSPKMPTSVAQLLKST